MRDRQKQYASNRKYNLAHTEEIKAYKHRYYLEHKEQKREYDQRYHQKNAELKKAISLRYRQNHREQISEKGKRYNADIKMRIMRHYSHSLIPYCACCKEDYLEFLTIDHINNDGAEHRKRIGGGGTRMYKDIEKNGYPGGFRVLCMNCNFALGKYGYCPHSIVKEVEA